MSGKHSQPDNLGRKTDDDGNVTNIKGTLDEPSRERPYNETKDGYKK
jgi:hypothetical protein